MPIARARAAAHGTRWATWQNLNTTFVKQNETPRRWQAGARSTGSGTCTDTSPASRLQRHSVAQACWPLLPPAQQ